MTNLIIRGFSNAGNARRPSASVVSVGVVVAIVGVGALGANVDLLFIALATDGVVASHHVVGSGRVLVTVSFLVACEAGMSGGSVKLWFRKCSRRT